MPTTEEGILRSEFRWAAVAIGMVSVIMLALIYAGVVQHINPPSNLETIDPKTLHLTGEFTEANLGTRVAAVHSFIAQAGALFQTGDPALSQQLAWQALENLRQQQASALAYFDVFWLLVVVMLALVPVVLLMKRSVAQKGAHVSAE